MTRISFFVLEIFPNTGRVIDGRLMASSVCIEKSTFGFFSSGSVLGGAGRVREICFFGIRSNNRAYAMASRTTVSGDGFTLGVLPGAKRGRVIMPLPNPNVALQKLSYKENRQNDYSNVTENA